MSVVAWDGKTLAADKYAECGGAKHIVTKIRRMENGTVLAWTGMHECGLLLAKWFEDGADTAKWPEFQRDKDRWSRLIVATKEGIYSYEQEPIPQQVENPFIAYGSGADFAIGAMQMAADAREAVEVANLHCSTCGFGVDAFDIIDVLEFELAKPLRFNKEALCR